MKVRTLILGVAIAALAGAVQGPIKLERKYKEGEKDQFKAKMVATMAMGEAEMTMDFSQTVKKVYENGDADVETQVGAMKVMFGGQEMPMPADQAMPPSTQRYTKFGAPVGARQGGDGMMSQMDFTKYAAMLGEGLEVGKEIKINDKDEKAKTEVTGTMKLDSVTDGVAKIIADLSVKGPEGDKPLKVKMTSLVDTASAKANKVEGTVTDLPEMQGMTIDQVKFTMERVK